MPIKKAAIKAWRQSTKRTLKNLKTKKAIKDLVKKTQQAWGKKDRDLAAVRVRAVIKAIDKAVQKKILKKNAGARKKSRLLKKINSLLK
jgi:small subunit ribosomal protein S20